MTDNDTYAAGFTAGYDATPLTADELERLFRKHSSQWQLGYQAGLWERRRREAYLWGEVPLGWEVE